MQIVTLPKLHVMCFSTGHEGDRNALGLMFIFILNLIRVSIKRCNLRLIKARLDFNALEWLVLQNKIISNLDFIYGFYEMS